MYRLIKKRTTIVGNKTHNIVEKFIFAPVLPSSGENGMEPNLGSVVISSRLQFGSQGYFNNR
jgi:hypothetical protein